MIGKDYAAIHNPRAFLGYLKFLFDWTYSSSDAVMITLQTLQRIEHAQWAGVWMLGSILTSNLPDSLADHAAVPQPGLSLCFRPRLLS